MAPDLATEPRQDGPPSGSTGRGVALTTVALTAGRLLTLVAGIVMVGLASHYLGVRSFGALTLGMAYTALFAVMTDLGLSTVVTRELSREPENAHQVLGTALGIGLALAAVAIGLGLGLMSLIYGGPANAAARQAIVILMAQVLVAPLTGISRAFFTARQRGYLIAAGDITLSVGMAAFTAIAVVLGLGYHAVVIAIGASYVAQALVMTGTAFRAGARIRPGRRGSLRLIVLALPLGGTFLISYLYFRLDVLLLSWLKGDVDVAIYGLAYRVLEGLMVLPGYVMLALFPSIVRSESDRPRLAATVGVVLSGMEAAALALAALMAIFSREIIAVLGGHEFHRAAPVLAILAVALAISYLNGVYGGALMALGRQRIMLWLSVVPLVVNLVANLALIPPLGVVGAAIAVVVSEIVGVVLIRRWYVLVAGPPVEPKHARILVAALVLAALAAAKFAVNLHSAPLIITLAGGTAGLILYAGALLLLGAVPSAILDHVPLSDLFLRTRFRR